MEAFFTEVSHGECVSLLIELKTLVTYEAIHGVTEPTFAPMHYLYAAICFYFFYGFLLIHIGFGYGRCCFASVD